MSLFFDTGVRALNVTQNKIPFDLIIKKGKFS